MGNKGSRERGRGRGKVRKGVKGRRRKGLREGEGRAMERGRKGSRESRGRCRRKGEQRSREGKESALGNRVEGRRVK